MWNTSGGNNLRWKMCKVEAGHFVTPNFNGTNGIALAVLMLSIVWRHKCLGSALHAQHNIIATTQAHTGVGRHWGLVAQLYDHAYTGWKAMSYNCAVVNGLLAHIHTLGGRQAFNCIAPH